MTDMVRETPDHQPKSGQRLRHHLAPSAQHTSNAESFEWLAASKLHFCKRHGQLRNSLSALAWNGSSNSHLSHCSGFAPTDFDLRSDEVSLPCLVTCHVAGDPSDDQPTEGEQGGLCHQSFGAGAYQWLWRVYQCTTSD